MRFFSFLLVNLYFSFPLFAATDEVIALKVTHLFYAARVVMGENKEFLNQPQSFKDKEGELQAQIKSWYQRMAKEELDTTQAEVGYMWKAVSTVLSDLINGKYKGRWKDSKFFSDKLIPARFASLVTKEYNKIAAGKSGVKWTTSDDYLVNSDNKADDWELQVMSNKFKAAKWTQGAPYSEESVLRGTKAFRYMTPEYFKASCLDCHGGAQGRQIHPGKNAAITGTLGGALSFYKLK